VRSYAAKGGSTVRPADYQVARVELSAGKEQALVLLHAASFCGSCGCTLLVLEHEANAWSLVSDISCVGRTVRVGDARSHGWRDLVIDAGDSFVLRFDGHSYPPSPQDGERVPAGSVAGTAIALR
jgi:putative lipoprotein